MSCSSGYVLNTAGNACVKIVCTNGASTTTKSTSNGTCPSISTSGNVVLTTTKTFYCSTSSVYPQGKYSDTENPVGGVTATTTNTCNTKVFFNKNNTDSGSTDANPTFRAVNVYDENVTTPTTNPTRTGYKFLG